MATTGLFVEIIVIGVLAELWFVAAFLAFLKGPSIEFTVSLVARMKDLTPIAAVVLLALTYVVGWIVNFATARIFDRSFSGKLRDRRFGGKDKYEAVRALVFQHGTSEALQDLLLDRHVIRIARSNVLNFLLLAIALLFHMSRVAHPEVLAVVIVTSFVLACFSFWQWHERTTGLYRRLAGIADVIRKDLTPPPSAVSSWLL